MTGVGVFLDSEPEDAWDASDAIVEQVRNLLARVALLDGGPRLYVGSNNLVGLVGNIINRTEAKMKQRGLGERARLRGNQILDDVELVLARIRRGE